MYISTCCAVLSRFSHLTLNVQLFETLWTIARQALLSTGFSGQAYWNELLRPSPRDLPDPGNRTCIFYVSCLKAGPLPTELPWKSMYLPIHMYIYIHMYISKYMYMSTYMYITIYMYIQVFVYIYIFLYIYMYFNIFTYIYICFNVYVSVQFSRSVVSDSLHPHELQHARPPCPSPTPGVHPNPCPSSQWWNPTISSSVVPFSSCPQSFPASGSFKVSQLFASGGQVSGVSASTSVLPMNTQEWSPLGWTGWTSLQPRGLSRVLYKHKKQSVHWVRSQCADTNVQESLITVGFCHRDLRLVALRNNEQDCLTQLKIILKNLCQDFWIMMFLFFFNLNSDTKNLLKHQQIWQCWAPHSLMV